MRRGLDTNVLIYAHMPDLPDHLKVRSFLLNQLANEDVTLVITPIILHEFVHIITDGKRFDPRAFALIERHQLGRKRIADTLFAACLLGHGVNELITCNPADFRIFDSLTLTNPRES